ncbi:OmpA/MotB domain protein [Candidatus Sulfopaludibacter sp. SbA4]|nr:OmpA/MotB domain protein [Candidatus Sulfopaludibacter sp. SbA4]
MKNKLIVPTILGLFCTCVVWGQNRPADRESVPIYRVTVIERTVKAVDYEYRGGPTPVDFRGTVLLPQAKGDAMVESKAGRTEIDARFQRLQAPTRYGAEYLTYVLWAITPEGHAKNLGEVLPGSSDHAHLHVTTDLQAFGLIVTAEPYSAVRQPSDVVVMENEIRPDTMGRIEEVQAKYELLPRGHYTYNVPAGFQSAEAQAERLPMDRYEALLEVYQAQNAVQIAQAAGADRYAPDTFAKAEELFRVAQQNQMQKADRSTIVTEARRAAQTAEDARAITIKRKQDEELAQARDQAAREQELRARAEADAQRAQSQASADRMQLEEERAARARAETEAAAARAVPLPPTVQPPVVVVQTEPAQPSASVDPQKTGTRVQLLQELSSAGMARDTPRGLVVTFPDADFRGTALSPDVYGGVSRIASIVAAHPGLYVEVDGHTSEGGSESRDQAFSYERAAAVREALVRSGVPVTAISSRGWGSSRPLVSNSSAAGREQNRRVEITISGDPIGSVASWDKTYPLIPQR